MVPWRKKASTITHVEFPLSEAKFPTHRLDDLLPVPPPALVGPGEDADLAPADAPADADAAALAPALVWSNLRSRNAQFGT